MVPRTLVVHETGLSENVSETESEHEQSTEVPIDTNPFVTVDLDSTRTQQSLSRQPSQEQLQTPVFTPRVLMPFLSPSLLSSPSSVEHKTEDETSRKTFEGKNSEMKKSEETHEKEPAENFVPQQSSASLSDGSASCDETDNVWTNLERNLPSELSTEVEQNGSMKFITYSENKSPEEVVEKSPKSGLPSDRHGLKEDESTPDHDVNPEFCRLESHSAPSSPNLVKKSSEYLSTYIERQDSVLNGLEANGGTRDFAVWFDRLAPDVHCDEDFHTETGTFGQDFWHNPFKKSKSLDRYLGLKE